MKWKHDSKIWDADNTMVRGQFIVLKHLLEKDERSQIEGLNSQLNELKSKKQIKLKVKVKVEIKHNKKK